MIRVTIAAPVELIAAANELSACLGLSEADRGTFTVATHEDADGAQYCVASAVVLPAFEQDAQSPLVEPPWGADMALAGSAQAVLSVWTEDAPVTATPDTIAAYIGDDDKGAVAAFGLTKL